MLLTNLGVYMEDLRVCIFYLLGGGWEGSLGIGWR